MKLINKILSKSNSYNYYKYNFERLKKENKELKEDKKYYENKIKELNEELFKKYNHDISEMNKNINSIQSNLLNINHSEELINNELKYAFVFNDTIKNSKWLKEKDFSLVNSAANYSFMYSLYRILNDAQPKKHFRIGFGPNYKINIPICEIF